MDNERRCYWWILALLIASAIICFLAMASNLLAS